MQNLLKPAVTSAKSAGQQNIQTPITKPALLSNPHLPDFPSTNLRTTTLKNVKVHLSKLPFTNFKNCKL